MTSLFFDIEIKARTFFYEDKIQSRLKNIRKSYAFFQKQGALFIHIPKTAGVSLYKALYGIDSLGHVPIIDYHGIYGKRRVNSMFTFCFVRHPYDRLQSAYSYLKTGGRGLPSDIAYQKKMEGIESFEDFVYNHLGREPIMKMVHFKTQSFYLKNASGQINVDFIGKFENLDNDFAYVCKELGKSEVTLPLKNVNFNKNKQDSYSEGLKTIMYKFYEEDFVNFGYHK